ncbi:hypothetical protein IMSAGC020_02513 [Lachnospiraceae bacterium]|nr:hypothetical protein IMSAGC020_02513 [Lachnospiraceae bacterium]
MELLRKFAAEREDMVIAREYADIKREKPRLYGGDD